MHPKANGTGVCGPQPISQSQREVAIIRHWIKHHAKATYHNPNLPFQDKVNQLGFPTHTAMLFHQTRGSSAISPPTRSDPALRVCDPITCLGPPSQEVFTSDREHQWKQVLSSPCLGDYHHRLLSRLDSNLRQTYIIHADTESTTLPDLVGFPLHEPAGHMVLDIAHQHELYKASWIARDRESPPYETSLPDQRPGGELDSPELASDCVGASLEFHQLEHLDMCFHCCVPWCSHEMEPKTSAFDFYAHVEHPTPSAWFFTQGRFPCQFGCPNGFINAHYRFRHGASDTCFNASLRRGMTKPATLEPLRIWEVLGDFDKARELFARPAAVEGQHKIHHCTKCHLGFESKDMLFCHIARRTSYNRGDLFAEHVFELDSNMPF